MRGALEVAEPPADRGGGPTGQLGKGEDIAVVDTRTAPRSQVEIGDDHVLVEGPQLAGDQASRWVWSWCHSSGDEATSQGSHTAMSIT